MYFTNTDFRSAAAVPYLQREVRHSNTAIVNLTHFPEKKADGNRIRSTLT
jgi:hypothetical protein